MGRLLTEQFLATCQKMKTTNNTAFFRAAEMLSQFLEAKGKHIQGVEYRSNTAIRVARTGQRYIQARTRYFLSAQMYPHSFNIFVFCYLFCVLTLTFTIS